MNTYSRAFVAAFCVTSALLAGCGGGGGGTPQSSILTVVTDWTNHANTGSVSEELDLYDANGLFVKELNVNQDVAGREIKSFAAVPAALYHLKGASWSQPNLGGVQTGSLDALVDLRTGRTIHIDVGNVPTQVVVSPQSATITVQQSQQFYATAEDVAGNFVFTPMVGAGIAWSSLGGTTTIDANSGIGIGSTPGSSGFVQATYSPGNLIGAATVNVTAFTVTQSKWTVLVYMNASNDLDQFSVPNILQMQKVADTVANLRFVVQWKQSLNPAFSPNPSFVGTRRYLIKPSSGNQVVSQLIQDMGTNIDMGDVQTMADFLNWGKTYFPGNRFCVVVWNHGNGWATGRALAQKLPTRGFSYDSGTGNNIDTFQLSQALGTLQPDILAWDCSLMQMIEVAYEARNQVKYVVGSEASPPGAGYPYDLVFAKFRANPDDTSANLTKAFVDGMVQTYPTSTGFNTTESVIDTTQIPALSSSISVLADALIANEAVVTTLMPQVRANAEGAAFGINPGYDDSTQYGRLYRDLYDCCSLLQSGAGGVTAAPAAVEVAAANVQTAISNAVIWNGHNGNDLNAHGVSIDFSDAATFAPKASDYGQLTIAKDGNHWPTWLAQSP